MCSILTMVIIIILCVGLNYHIKAMQIWESNINNNINIAVLILETSISTKTFFYIMSSKTLILKLLFLAVLYKFEWGREGRKHPKTVRLYFSK